MEYPFPKIEKHIVYPRTFLKDVCVSFCFRTVLSHEEAVRKFIEYRQTNFGISYDEYVELNSREEDAVKIGSSDNQVIFNFCLDCISVKIKFPTYKQFCDLKSYMSEIFGFLKSQNVDEIELLRLSKFNEIQFGLPSENASVQLAMQGIFSTDMMNWDGFENPDFSDVARWERRLDFVNESTQTRVMGMYGFAKDDTDKRKGSLILKISAEKHGPIELGDIDENLRLCNDIVDGAFHWAASDDILKAMREK